MTRVSLEPQEPTVLSREPSRASLGAPRSPHLIERAAVDEQHVRPPLRVPSFPWTPFPGRRGPVCSRLCPECRCFRRERGWASPSPCPPSPTPATGKKQSSEDQGTGTGHPFSVPGFVPTVLSLENDPERGSRWPRSTLSCAVLQSERLHDLSQIQNRNRVFGDRE